MKKNNILAAQSAIMMICAMLPASCTTPDAARAPIVEQKSSVSTRDARRLVADLAARRFTKREESQKRLLSLADKDAQVVLDQCIPVYGKTADPEVKARLREVLNRVFEIQVLNMPRGFLGIHMGLVRKVDQNGAQFSAVLVVGVVPGTAAATAGLLENDMILRIDDIDINKLPSLQAFVQYVQSRRPGDTVRLAIMRMDKPQIMSVKLGGLPEAMKDELLGTQTPVEEQFENWLQEHLKH
jgi:C-terminal processing protease CtpA/Prc